MITASVRYMPWMEATFKLTDYRMEYKRSGWSMCDLSCSREPPYSMLFTFSRSLEENMDEFKHIVETYAEPFWRNYSNKEYMYKVAPYVNDWFVDRADCFLLPVVCLDNKDYTSALRHLKVFEYLYKQEAIMYENVDFYRMYRDFHRNIKEQIPSSHTVCDGIWSRMRVLWRRLTII